MTPREEREAKKFVSAVQVVMARAAENETPFPAHIALEAALVQQDIDRYQPEPVSEERAASIADALSRLYLAATDPLGSPPPVAFGSPAEAIGHYLALGTEGLCDLAAASGPGMYQVLERLDADELRYALATVAGLLYECGYSPPVRSAAAPGA